MQSAAVVALALLESASAFQAPALKASTKAVGATMFSEDAGHYDAVQEPAKAMGQPQAA